MADDDFPEVTTEQLKKAMTEGLERHRQDEKDRRTLRGKYAPPIGNPGECMYVPRVRSEANGLFTSQRAEGIKGLGPW